MKSLRQKFEAWLEAHFDVAHTQKGSRRTTRGVPVYEGDISRLLGSRFGWGVVNRWRAGETVPGRLLYRLERVVELEDPEAIRGAVLDERFVDEVRHAARHFDEFGAAPDGGRMRGWVERCRERTGAPLSSDEARELWRRFRPAPANQRRRTRRAA